MSKMKELSIKIHNSNMGFDPEDGMLVGTPQDWDSLDMTDEEIVAAEDYAEARYEEIHGL